MLTDDMEWLTKRALWEMQNLMKCIPDELWDNRYDGIPMWKFVYHTLYSMDRWYINPADPDYRDPDFHVKGLNDLNIIPETERIDREQMENYFHTIEGKITDYLKELKDEELSVNPEGCELSRMCLIMGQIRHWHRHMGVIYGFLIQDTGKWPYVLNMYGKYPDEPMPNFFG